VRRQSLPEHSSDHLTIMDLSSSTSWSSSANSLKDSAVKKRRGWSAARGRGTGAQDARGGTRIWLDPSIASKALPRNEEVAPFRRSRARQGHRERLAMPGIYLWTGEEGLPPRAMWETTPWEGQTTLISFHWELYREASKADGSEGANEGKVQPLALGTVVGRALRAGRGCLDGCRQCWNRPCTSARAGESCRCFPGPGDVCKTGTARNGEDCVQRQEAQRPGTYAGKAAGVETVTDTDTTPQNGNN